MCLVYVNSVTFECKEDGPTTRFGKPGDRAVGYHLTSPPAKPESAEDIKSIWEADGFPVVDVGDPRLSKVIPECCTCKGKR